MPWWAWVFKLIYYKPDSMTGPWTRTQAEFQFQIRLNIYFRHFGSEIRFKQNPENFPIHGKKREKRKNGEFQKLEIIYEVFFV